MADSAEKKTQTEEKKLPLYAIDPAAASSLLITQQGPHTLRGPPLRGSEVPPGNQFKIQFAAFQQAAQDDLNTMEAHCY